MKLYDINLPDIDCECDSLYFRAFPPVKAKGGILFADRDVVISFDTYFNCFSYLKYKKYTVLTQLGIRLSLKGSFEVRLMMRSAESPDKAFLLKTLSFSSSVKQNLTFYQDIAAFVEEGFLFVELVSQSDGGEFHEGEYFTDLLPLRNAGISLVFCTYKREKYLFDNIDNIVSYLKKNPSIKDKFQILVIDNGNSIDPSKSRGFSVFPNKNLGGSGGFTRGIIEAYKDRDRFSHFLLMDDDIVFDAKILTKTLGLLCLARDISNLAIGGAMLELNNPSIQYEMGGKTNGIGLSPAKNNLDVSTIAALLENERHEPFDYNAWWYMCMPLSAVDKMRLPLPLFIKGDDVEYGLRFSGEIIVCNGIGVWHEGFATKRSPELEYYIKRNEMIISAIHFPKLGILSHMRKLFYAVGYRLACHRYYEMNLIFSAIEDFLKGPSHLSGLDAEQLHRALRSNLPELLDDGRLLAEENVVFDKTCASAEDDSSVSIRQMLTLNGYLVPKLFYSSKDKKGYRSADLSKKSTKPFYKAIRVLQYNTEAQKGFVTRLDKGQLISASFRLFLMFFRLIFSYRKIANAYRAALPQLTSKANWQKLLGIDN